MTNPSDNLLIDVDDDYRISDVQSAEEADDARYQLLIDMARIKGQIDEAHEFFLANGRHRDYGWLRRAKMALAFKAAACQRLQEKAAEYRRHDRRAKQKSRDDMLIGLLRKHVGETVFKSIVAELP